MSMKEIEKNEQRMTCKKYSLYSINESLCESFDICKTKKKKVVKHNIKQNYQGAVSEKINEGNGKEKEMGDTHLMRLNDVSTVCKSEDESKHQDLSIFARPNLTSKQQKNRKD
ncbi:hypothetical protein ABFS83_07G084800 [Erythranthe nasuta]